MEAARESGQMGLQYDGRAEKGSRGPRAGEGERSQGWGRDSP